MQITLRFAPSPNGLLHLGHAYSALLNHYFAQKMNGKLLIRIEDIDQQRCSKAFEQQQIDDLAFLKVEWVETIRRQSEHFNDYREMLLTLERLGVIYPACLSRREIHEHSNKLKKSGQFWPDDPDGNPQYPGTERDYSKQEKQQILQSGKPFNWRLDLRAVQNIIGDEITWHELVSLNNSKEIVEESGNLSNWGDPIIARKDIPVSYHLCVVMDDVIQQITHIIRGEDIKQQTTIHMALKKLLFPKDNKQWVYYHHDLIMDSQSDYKLSKSNHSTSLKHLRHKGYAFEDIIQLIEEKLSAHSFTL